MDTLKVPLNRAGSVISGISVWEWSGAALDEGHEASEWFSNYLGKPSRLVRFNTGRFPEVPFRSMLLFIHLFWHLFRYVHMVDTVQHVLNLWIAILSVSVLKGDFIARLVRDLFFIYAGNVDVYVDNGIL